MNALTNFGTTVDNRLQGPLGFQYGGGPGIKKENEKPLGTKLQQHHLKAQCGPTMTGFVSVAE